MLSDFNGTVVGMHPNVSSLKTSNYTITTSDYLIGAGILSSNITITLPSSPTTSDQYLIKDVEGYAGQYSITIDGNGNNIDGTANFVLAQPFASISLTYTGTQWSVVFLYAGSGNGNGFGTLANRPIQGQSGRTYYATDQSAFYYDDGNSWKIIGPQVKPIYPPSTSDFTWINQGSTVATDTGSGLLIDTFGINSGTRNARALVKSAPSTPYSIIVGIEYTGLTTFGANNGLVGVCFRESSSGKMHVYAIDFNSSGDGVVVSTKYNSPTSFNSDYNNKVNDFAASLIWLRITDDGSLRICDYSRDGLHWANFHFVSRTDFITADQVGLFVDPIFQDIKANFISWE